MNNATPVKDKNSLYIGHPIRPHGQPTNHTANIIIKDSGNYNGKFLIRVCAARQHGGKIEAGFEAAINS